MHVLQQLQDKPDTNYKEESSNILQEATGSSHRGRRFRLLNIAREIIAYLR